MLWALLVLPAALIVVPRLTRSRRGQGGPVPGWSVPLARLEMSPRGRRPAPSGLSDLVDRSGPLGSPATLSRFGLSRLGLVVVTLVALAAVVLLLAPHLRG